MIKRVAFDAALALALLSLVAPSASAACNPPKSVSTYNSFTGAYVFFHTSLPSPTTAIGKFWDAAGDHTGSCNDGNQSFLYICCNPGDISINLSLGEACVTGCPSGNLWFQLTAANSAGGTQTIVTKIPETPAGANNFDFSTQLPDDVELRDYPRPRVTSSSRAGDTVNLTLGLDSTASLYRNGTASDITGFNVVSASSQFNPGPRAEAYTLRSFIPAPGGAAGTGSATVECTHVIPHGSWNDQWVAFQLVSAIGGPSNAVGTRTRVKCDPALANPRNVVPKKGMGTGTSD
jgi:hypothetical protein